MNTFTGKTAVVTGGAQGIGRGIARSLAAEGMKLALADIDGDALDAVRDELSQVTDVETFVLDVRDREEYAKVAAAVGERLGPVAVLCNNAGVVGGVNATKVSYEQWDWVIGVNLTGVFNGIQTFLPGMLDRGDGHIVNTASTSGLAGTGAGILYHTSKHGVVGLSESLRADLEPLGIGVSVLCPGPVATNAIDNSSRVRPMGAPEPFTSDAGIAFPKELIVGALANGAHPDEVGRMVLDGIKANCLYILTDDIYAGQLRARTDDIIAAMPSATR